ncbi:hypothetical protein DL767_008560 [Monosporascus sp. MG133]|nr:hypothetical protein DL767_008560 [Monosporascus sp. MG133]
MLHVVEYLESTGKQDNTFILFISDNGAEGTLPEALPMLNGATSMGALIRKHYDNFLESIGNRDSFTWYGVNWACVSMAPSRGFRTSITEGGIRCPCLVRYPPLTATATCTMNGQHTSAFTTVMNVLPTVLELAGAPHPHPQPFGGREVIPACGRSWVTHPGGITGEVQDPDTTITGREPFGLRAIRQGTWKAVYMMAPRGRESWELYEMEADPGEISDLAERESEVLKRLVQQWNVYCARRASCGCRTGIDGQVIARGQEPSWLRWGSCYSIRSHLLRLDDRDPSAVSLSGPPSSPPRTTKTCAWLNLPDRDLVEEQPVDLPNGAPLALGHAEEGEDGGQDGRRAEYEARPWPQRGVRDVEGVGRRSSYTSCHADGPSAVRIWDNGVQFKENPNPKMASTAMIAIFIRELTLAGAPRPAMVQRRDDLDSASEKQHLSIVVSPAFQKIA